VDSAIVQRFVGIDIPNPNQEKLIQKGGLDHPLVILEELDKGIDADLKGLWSKLCQPFLLPQLIVMIEPQPAETSVIIKPKVHLVIVGVVALEINHDQVVLSDWLFSWKPQKTPCHL
jgi:hypothetical protein